jgi:hypothetical protein
MNAGPGDWSMLGELKGTLWWPFRTFGKTLKFIIQGAMLVFIVIAVMAICGTAFNFVYAFFRPAVKI